MDWINAMLGRNWFVVGPTPNDEDCAQLGTDDYYVRSPIEIKAYIDQLERTYAGLPEGCSFASKSFDHDMGRYTEVVLWYPTKYQDDLEELEMEDDHEENNDKMIELQEIIDSIYACERGCEKWDEKAIAILSELSKKADYFYPDERINSEPSDQLKVAYKKKESKDSLKIVKSS